MVADPLLASTTERAAAWLARLIQTPSVNPAHAGPTAGETGEAAIAHLVAEALNGLGASEVRVADTPAGTGRPNVYGIFEGTSDRWVALDVHLDTVGVEHMTGDPFSGELRDGKVHGRGAVDTKGALGAMLAVLEQLSAAGARPVPNLVVVGTASEESAGLFGACAFRDWLHDRDLVLDQLVIAEPTACAPVYAHKGAVSIEFTVSGRGAHTSEPELGLNAIYAASRVMLAFEAEHASLRARPATGELGTGSVAVTTVAGGHSRNIVPDTCSFYIGRRLVPGEDPRTEYRRLVELAEHASPLPIAAHPVAFLTPFEADRLSPLVTDFEAWTGNPATVTGLGTNAFQYSDAVARQIVVFGPGEVAQAHAAEEWVELEQLHTAVTAFDRWLHS